MLKRKNMILRPLITALAVLLAIPAVSAGFAAGKNSPPFAAARPTEKLLVVGHRGAAGLAPENTLAAFKTACEIDVNAVELDVLLSGDGHLVVHHDYALMPENTRSPDGTWLNLPGPVVKDLNLAQLKTHDVGRLKPGTKYARRFPDQKAVDGERIPTLVEVISLLNAKCPESTRLWIEIKSDPEKADLTPPPETVADALTTLLRAQEFSARPAFSPLNH